MILLVIGGSGSGKSEYAEQRTINIGKNQSMYYLATMQVYGEEGQQKVNRHRIQREGKGFITLEQPFLRLHDIPKNGVVLLECLSNLTANAMFDQITPKTPQAVITKIFDDIQLLCRQSNHVVIVSNTVFEDGVLYDAATQGYLEVLGKLNQMLAQSADEVVEVVAGIPVILKHSCHAGGQR